jgi:hypothetical protein
LDALSYRTGVVLCRVEVEPVASDGEEAGFDRKSVSLTRKLLAFSDITDTLRLFTVDCAERALPHFEKRHPDDKRVRRCIEQTRAYLRGEISIKELSQARADAADDAAAYAAYAAADARTAEKKWQAGRLDELLRKNYPDLFAMEHSDAEEGFECSGE